MHSGNSKPEKAFLQHLRQPLPRVIGAQVKEIVYDTLCDMQRYCGPVRPNHDLELTFPRIENNSLNHCPRYFFRHFLLQNLREPFSFLQQLLPRSPASERHALVIFLPNTQLLRDAALFRSERWKQFLRCILRCFPVTLAAPRSTDNNLD